MFARIKAALLTDAAWIAVSAVCSVGAFLCFAAIAEGAPLAYELHVELDGQDYIADWGLTATECDKAARDLFAVELAKGVVVDVPADAPVYCLAE